MKFKSLKTRVLGIFSISLFGFLLVFGWFIYYLLEGQIEDDAIINMDEECERIEMNIERYGLKNITSPLPYVVLEGKKIVAKSKNFKVKIKDKYLEKEDIYPLKSGHKAIFTYKGQKYTILVYDTVYNELKKISSYLIELESLLFIVLVFLVNNLLNKVINPIKMINKTAKEISIADFKSHIPSIKQNNEIGELITTFNEMIDRLKTEVEKIERFNSDVSHELKSPLTVINAQIELIQRKKRDSEFYEKSISLIKEESDKINSIVNDMLSLTKTDSKVEFELCDFNAILIDVVESLTLLAEEKGISIEIKSFQEAIKMQTNP